MGIDYTKGGGVVFGQIDEMCEAIRMFAMEQNKLVTMNRLYQQNDGLQINFSVDGAKYLLNRPDSGKLEIWKTEPLKNGSSIVKKFPVEYAQITSGEFITLFA